MGYGEVTINRYIGGQLPSREHSAQLLEVLSSHKIMEKRLEENKGLIKPIAYSKCRQAIDQLSVLYGQKRIEVVTRYMLAKAVEITPLALQKLLYFAQAFFKALYNETLFLDDCQAWAHGPVIRTSISSIRTLAIIQSKSPCLKKKAISLNSLPES